MRAPRIGYGVSGILLALALAGCSGHPGSGRSQSAAPGAKGASEPQTRNYYKIGPPYEVDGVWYYPGVDYSYDQTGIASWYGPDFHGHYTANGEVYDMNTLTAAHKTLPMPTIVRVTNLDNGRSIVVRINDRGPFVRGRIIDLSRRSAQLLGVYGPGTAKVRVQVLAAPSREAATLAMAGQVPSAATILAETEAHPGAAGPIVAAAPAAVADPVAPVAVATPAGAPQPVTVVAQTASPVPVAVTAAPAARTPAMAAARPVTAPQVDGRPSLDTVVAEAINAPPAAKETRTTPLRPTPAVLKVTPPEPRPAPNPAPPRPPEVSIVPVSHTAIYIQVGAFARYDNASRLRAKLASLGRARVSEARVSGQPYYRVQLGPAPDVPAADKLLDNVVRAGYPEARIVVE